MARKTGTDIAEKQIQRLSGATAEVTSGINRVTESPTAKAAENLDKALAGYTKAVQSGKMADRLKAVTLEDWKSATIAKVDRIPGGIEAARGKLVDFHNQRNQFQDTIDSELSRMPSKTLVDSQNRMIKQMTSMAKFRYVPKGGAR